MRPTIPLAAWRIAADVAATRAVQQHPALPATGCTCGWCRNWAGVAATVLSPELQAGLSRLGVEVAHPSELYAFAPAESGAGLRVVYHCVGELLSGPPAWREDPAHGPLWTYVELQAPPASVSALVVYQDQVYEPPLARLEVSGGRLIRVDLRLWAPWRLPEPQPPISATNAPMRG